jgi:hypothetical protein
MNLPTEILVHILKYLNSDDLLKMKLVSKWHYEFITDNLWYINPVVYQLYLQKRVLQLLNSGELTPGYLSDLIVNQRFQLSHTSILIYSLQNCSDSVNKLQLDNIKYMYRSVYGNTNQYVPVSTRVIFNKIGQLCATFLLKMKVRADFLLGDGCHLDLLEHLLNQVITDPNYSDRTELLEHYINRQILNNERNQLNDLYYLNRTFLYQCLRRLAVCQQSEKCLELMNTIVLSLNLEEDQQTLLMNEVLFTGVWKKKNKVIDFAMERGSQYDFNNNVITRLLIRDDRAATSRESQVRE